MANTTLPQQNVYENQPVLEPGEKNFRRNDPEYKKLKALKAAYNNEMRDLFGKRPDWKKLSRSMHILNVPTLMEDRLRVQAEIARVIKKQESK